MNLADKNIFITGASAGIGKSMVAYCAAQGVQNIAVMGRRAEMLEALRTEFPEVNFVCIAGDLGQPTDVKRAISTLEDQWDHLDILVNNAGVVSAGPIEQISDEDIIQMIQINVTGLILLTKGLAPLLAKSTGGGVMNVSSGLGYIARPYYSVYAATKAAVKQFTDSLRREWHDRPLHMMTVFPTATDTPMMTTAKMDRAMDSPDMVAEKSMEGMVKGEREVIFGGEQRIQDIKLDFNDPEAMDAKMVANLEAMYERTKEHRAM